MKFRFAHRAYYDRVFVVAVGDPFFCNMNKYLPRLWSQMRSDEYVCLVHVPLARLRSIVMQACMHGDAIID